MNYFFPTKKPSEDLIRKYEKFGFEKHLIIQAWESCKGSENNLMNHLLFLSLKGSPGVYRNREDTDLHQAIELSLNDQKGVYFYEPLNPEQRVRPGGMPVGLKNVGNTCYVNSLFQSYFTSEKFVATILSYDQEVAIIDDCMTASQSSKGDRDVKRVRVETSIKLVKALQKLFAMMIKSHKKYVDPTEVLNLVVDDMGQNIPIGDQKDITEYHLNFLSRIEEAFYYQEKFLKAKKGAESPASILIEDLPTSFASFSSTRSLHGEAFTSALLPQDNSVISKHFFGRIKQFMIFVQDGEKIVEEKETICGPIILDVVEKNLYQGLEQYCNYSIEDFRAPNGELTKAEGSLWVTRPPELLFIQLNRVIFNKETGYPVKTNDTFTFEKEFYLDRFMHNYRSEAIKINKQIADLKEELRQKESALEKLLNSFESKTDIVKVLEFTGEFLKKQIKSNSHLHSDPTMVGKVASEDKIIIATDIVFQYKQILEKRIQELKQSIISIKANINSVWGKLNRHKYHLVSILVHDGSAGSGHYYSFNRDIDRDTWKRFSDFQVSEEKEEVVMKESLGGHANMSAYCFVYLADNVAKEELNNKTAQAKDVLNEAEKNFEIEKQHYLRLLPVSLAQDVFVDNLNFHDEVDEFKFTSFLKEVVELYKVRYEMVTKALQSKTAKSPPTHLNSFGIFLKYDPYFEHIFKWYILDTSLQDAQKEFDKETQNKFKLKNLKSSPHLLQKLSNRLNALSKPFSFSNLVLSSQEENQLDCKLAEYSAEFPIIIYTKFLLLSFLNENWRDACYTAKLILEFETNPQSFIYKLVKDSTKVNCLRMALLIEKLASQNQFEQANQILPYLTALIKGLLKPEDIHVPQVKMILVNALNSSQEPVKNSAFQRFREDVQIFLNAVHATTELDKVIEQYSPLELQKDIQAFASEDFYTWKNINEDSPSNQLARLMEGFRRELQLFVGLHNLLHSSKTVVKLEERKNLGYILS